MYAVLGGSLLMLVVAFSGLRFSSMALYPSRRVVRVFWVHVLLMCVGVSLVNGGSVAGIQY